MITIGITTFNRKKVLKMSARSLYQSTLKHKYNLRIYDDASDEYDKEELQKIFPNAATIHRHKKRLGPDGNMRFMYESFLKSDDEYFFNADADLIYKQDWLEKGLELIKHTDGVLSLFNTANHVTIKDCGELLQKNDVGAAGVLFERKRIKQIIKSLNNMSTPPL